MTNVIPLALQRLRKEVEQAKRVLSSSPQVNIEIENFQDGQPLVHTLSRAKFEELNIDLFKKTLGPVKQVRLALGCDCSWVLRGAPGCFGVLR